MEKEKGRKKKGERKIREKSIAKFSIQVIIYKQKIKTKKNISVKAGSQSNQCGMEIIAGSNRNLFF